MEDLENIIRTFSPSRLQTLATCHYKFFRRYVLGERTPLNVSLAFGSAFDETANVAYTEAMEEGGPFENEKKAADIFAWQWDQVKEEIEEWDIPSPVIKDQGVRLAKEWTREIACRFIPLKVQADWTVRWTDVQWEVRGILDLVAQPVRSKKIIIADTKTAGRRWKQAKVFYALQPAAYSLGSQAIMGDPIEDFQFHIGVRKKDPEAYVEELQIGEKERMAYLKKVANARALVQNLYKSGVWLPTARDSQHFLCSRRFCPFWRECEKEWGGRIVE